MYMITNGMKPEELARFFVQLPWPEVERSLWTFVCKKATAVEANSHTSTASVVERYISSCQGQLFAPVFDWSGHAAE
jgi:hypothetical protein